MLFNLVKRKLCGDLLGTFQCLKVSTGKLEWDSSGGAVIVIGQMEMGANWKRTDLD